MNASKLVTKIRQPAWGKGWYKVTVSNAAADMSDELLIGHIRSLHPQATGIQITREYRV